MLQKHPNNISQLLENLTLKLLVNQNKFYKVQYVK